MRARPNATFAFSNALSGGESNRFHGHSEGRVAFPMDGMNPRGCGSNNTDIKHFGGEPFYMHMGKMCHRGAHPFKKPDMHPTETAKRVFYREDGSGRDGYIKANNGGLTVSKASEVMGTDTQALYASGLRGYDKDKVSCGYHRVSMPLRIADGYIESQLKVEEPDGAHKHQRKLLAALDRDYKLESNSRNGSGFRTHQPMAQSIGSDDVKSLLWQFGAKVNKEDIYFRNQDKLMRNAILPEAERQKRNEKMRFQQKHSDVLC